MKNLDKVAHFFASAWLVFAIFLFTNSFDIAFFGAFGVGLAWEIFWKYYKQKPFDFYDIVANFVGCWFTLLIFGIKIGLS